MVEDSRANPSEDAHARAFEAHRRMLLGAAYRVLGTMQDSEDAVQETWLRWKGVDLANVQNTRSYLLRAITRNALNILRSQQRRREEYVGPWLPEPASTDGELEPGRTAEVADEVSLALLVVLQSLSPEERVAFVLWVVFGLPYPELAETLDRSESAVRQLVSRARTHVRTNAPRHPVDPDTHQALTATFLAAAKGATPLEDVVSILAPDVVLTTDAGGRAQAALQPITGSHKVLRFIAAVLAKPDVAALQWSLGEINGIPALVAHTNGVVDSVVWTTAENKVVTRIDMIRNPDKLSEIQASAP